MNIPLRDPRSGSLIFDRGIQRLSFLHSQPSLFLSAQFWSLLPQITLLAQSVLGFSFSAKLLYIFFPQLLSLLSSFFFWMVFLSIEFDFSGFICKASLHKPFLGIIISHVLPTAADRVSETDTGVSIWSSGKVKLAYHVFPLQS